MDKNKKILLGLLGVLLLTKFALVPWYDYQDQQIDAIEISAKKLNRALSIESNEASIDAELARLDQMKQQLDQSLMQFDSAANASVEVQRIWGQAFVDQQLTMQMFNWTGQRQLGSSPYWVARVIVTVDGNFHQTLGLFLQFQQQNPFISLAELKTNNPSGIDFPNNEQVSATLDVLFKADGP